MSDPVNAADIGDDAILWRRVDSRMIDRSTNSLQTWAWKDQNKELSVYVAAETTEQKVLAAGKPGQVIIRITAGALRKLGHIVVRDPEPDEPSHSIIYPYPKDRIMKKLCEKSSWD